MSKLFDGEEIDNLDALCSSQSQGNSYPLKCDIDGEKCDEISKINRNNLTLDGDHFKYRLCKKFLGKGSYSAVNVGYVEFMSTIENNAKYIPKIKVGDSVAIKKINLSKLTEVDLMYVKNEERICRSLIGHTCQNIVAIYDVITTKRNLYIVMELLTGSTMSSILIKPMKDNYVRYFMAQIVNAIVYLNANSIVHGDVKPDNVLMSCDHKTIKVCDFGFSFSPLNTINGDDMNTESGGRTICGSLIYMAPEMRSIRYAPNPKIDIWSIGMICHEMIYGYHPYRGVKDGSEIIKAVSRMNIEKSAYIDASDNSVSILKSMLDVNPYQRCDIEDLVSNGWLVSNKNNCGEIRSIVIDASYDHVEYQQRMNHRFKRLREEFKLSKIFLNIDKKLFSNSCPGYQKIKNKNNPSNKSESFSYKKVPIESVLFGAYFDVITPDK
jgi:serine/threonine protein kinase